VIAVTLDSSLPSGLNNLAPVPAVINNAHSRTPHMSKLEVEGAQPPRSLILRVGVPAVLVLNLLVLERIHQRGQLIQSILTAIMCSQASSVMVLQVTAQR